MEHEAIPGTFGKQRIEALSDGLYAIALTLLVLDIKVPVLEHGASSDALVAALVALVPRVGAWLLSFWVMSAMWLNQLRVLALLHALDWGMARVQLLVLACVSLMPFSTALVSEHGNVPVAVALYAANLLAIALLSLVFTHMLVRSPRLQARALDAAAAHRLYLRGGIVASCALVALVLAPFVGSWSLVAMAGQLFSPSPHEAAPAATAG